MKLSDLNLLDLPLKLFILTTILTSIVLIEEPLADISDFNHHHQTVSLQMWLLV